MNDLGQYQAVIFDLDGVLANTAEAHFKAWKEVFDAFLVNRFGQGVRRFDREDYRDFVDGLPRHDGIRSFARSRTVELKESAVERLGELKNRRYHRLLEAGEFEVIDDSIEVVRGLDRQGVVLGVASSSKNAKRVLDALQIADLFSVRADGVTLQEQGLRGKPQPDLFIYAVDRLGVRRQHCAVVEDARSGVEAGKAGGFGLVVGLGSDKEHCHELRDAGADVAVTSLRDIYMDEGAGISSRRP